MEDKMVNSVKTESDDKMKHMRELVDLLTVPGAHMSRKTRRS